MASKCFLPLCPHWSGLSSGLSCSRRPGSTPCVTFLKDRDSSLRRNWNRSSPASADLELRCAATSADVKGAWKNDQEEGLLSSGTHGHDVGMDLPPLRPSLAIALPEPEGPIAYETETVKHFMSVANRLHIDLLKPWIVVAVSWCSHAFAMAISRERFDAICYYNVIAYALDDILLDRPNEVVLDQLGIDRGVVESHTTILAYVRHLHSIFEQETAPLSNPQSPIETMMWESGEQLRRLSTSCPEWFPLFSNDVLKFFETSVNSNFETTAGNYESVRDREAYTRMRMVNAGAVFSVRLLELAVNVYLDRNVRAHPTYEQLKHAACVHTSFANDIYSYSMEIGELDNPRNIIKVLMDVDGLTLPQAARRTIDIMNVHAATIMDLEKEMMLVTGVGDQQHFRDSEPQAGLVWASDLSMWVDDLKLLMSGNLQWHSLAKRFRHPLAVFPELRECEHGTVGN